MLVAGYGSTWPGYLHLSCNFFIGKFSTCVGEPGDPLREQLQLNTGEMEEEDHRRELVGENTELPDGACESIVHPEQLDGAVEVSNMWEKERA